MKPTNTIIIMSDEHRSDFLGCAGDPVAKTPHMDSLANRGVTFTNAYCNSPICVPTRASIATGRYIHDNRCWDSAQAYHGQIPGWGHRLIEKGHEVVSVGKLHYRDTQDSNGFSREILPMHILNGVGWVKGLLRNPLPTYDEAAGYSNEIGSGESVYTQYDRNVSTSTCDWIRNEGHQHTEKPWVLFASFVAPHYPLIAPEEFYNLYSDDEIPPPFMAGMAPELLHPAVAEVRKYFKYDDYFDEEKMRIARRAYYGLCSFLDHNIGRILNTLDECNLTENTRIIYSSDHGDCLGNRGIWAKSVMYEESVGIPMIMAGPDIAENEEIETPVTHVDFYQTIMEAVGEPLNEEEEDLPGHSMLGIARGEKSHRPAFSEYHDGGSITGSYMFRQGQWKYIYHAGFSPQLFDMENDPQETCDLAGDPVFADICQLCEAGLREICDPEKVNEAAFEDQRRKLDSLGGKEAISKFETFDFTPVPSL
jgi:choline-sulfatase